MTDFIVSNFVAFGDYCPREIVGSRDDVLELRRYYTASTDPELIARCEARLKGAVETPAMQWE